MGGKDPGRARGSREGLREGLELGGGLEGPQNSPPRGWAPRSPRAPSGLRGAGPAAPGGLRRRPRRFQLLEPPAFPGCWPFLTSRGPTASLFRSLVMTVGAHLEVQGHLLSHNPELDHLQSAFAATGPRTGTGMCSGDPILSATQTGGNAASAQGPLLMENRPKVRSFCVLFYKGGHQMYKLPPKLDLLVYLFCPSLQDSPWEASV